MAAETAEDIDRKAAEWAAKADRGLSPAEEASLQRWVDQDPRRLGAYGRMRAIALHTERVGALGPRILGAPPASRLAPSRRAFVLGGSGIAAGVAGAIGLGLTQRGRRYETRKGEVRQIALGDGSAMTLNTASIAITRFSRTRREVRLLAGEALFEVARDVARPFYLLAGPVTLQSPGGSFNVSALPRQAVKVLVREGVAELTGSSDGGSPIRLVDHMRAIADETPAQDVAHAGMAIAQVSDSDLQRDLAWRDGRIAFEGQTLAQAASEFGRYSDVRIIVDDPRLAGEEIAGLYQANDPVGFAKAIAASLGAQARVADGEVRITP